MSQNVITIFKNIKDTTQPFHLPVNDIIDRIRDGRSEELIKKIRTEKDKKKINELKQQLPAICFSGKFNKRNDDSILEHSGLICLDFDQYDTQKKLHQHRDKLIKDEYVYCVFISPSGKGLKVLIRVPSDIDMHVKYFASLQQYFDSPFFDSTSKNISRVCYESYDPIIHVNEESLLWDKIIETPNAIDKKEITIPITDQTKIVDILIKWWEKKYPMNEGQRNQNAFILASSFNDFGIEKSLAEYVLNGFQSQDFNLNEIKRTIDSAYSNIANFGTRVYEDSDTLNAIKSNILKGKSKTDIKKYFEDIDEEVLDNVIDKIQEEGFDNKFWTKNKKGVIKIFHLKFKMFLEENGFYKYNPEGSKNYVFVKVTNNLIDHASEKQIKDFILKHLLTVDDIEVYNYFAEHTKYFREEFLTLLDSIDVFFIEDTKNESYIYYKNCAVKITNDTVTPIDYIDLGGYVWKDHVIDRDYTDCESIECDYKKFVSNICAKDDKRIESTESTIGYLMHGYKNLSYCPAVILNDEVISDNPEGGTGKGLFMNALQHMKKLVVIDGKGFNFEKSFAYQLVSADTQILCFDDVRKHFDFERLFSVITEGLTLEKKNKDAIKIPFKKSPKVAITTNYAIKGKGNSFERRKWELELNQYYNKSFTPYDEFGKLMFGDWSADEWCRFDNYMIYCLQFYMNKGLVKSSFVNLKIRQLSAETCHEFIEWCGLLDGKSPNEDFDNGHKIYKQELYMDFISENPDFAPKAKMTVSRTKFYQWLNSYAVFKTGVSPDEGKDHKGKWIRMRSKHEAEYNSKLDI
jgi:hypothetical protein